MRKVIYKCGLEHEVLGKKKINEVLNKHFGFENDIYGLVDSIIMVLRKFENYGSNTLALLLLSNLLVVTRGN